MTRPRVSIVIPTRNAGPTLDAVLSAIAAQDGDFNPEIIAIDSGSTDDTLQRLRQARAMVLTVPGDTFNHGATRNQALAQAAGEFAVLLVQDAVPVSRRWLGSLISPLLRDPLTAGSFARQVPAQHASRLTAHYHAQWVAAQPRPRTVGPLSADVFNRMTPADRHSACAFDNVCSCVRLSVWREHPFKPATIAEDLEWACEVLLAGHKLAYVPEAVVQHSHERPIKYELERAYLVHQRLQELFGLTTVPTLMAFVRAIGTTIPINARLAAREPSGRARAVLRAAALGVAQPLGQYLGARASREGRQFLRPRGI